VAHPLFARLERQIDLVRRELANAAEAERRFAALRRKAARNPRDSELYHEWSHNASLADGIAAIYTGLESVLEAVGNEIDEYSPRGGAAHADLIDGMAVAVQGLRPAVLNEATRQLMHELRKFRHVTRHNYALQLRRRDVGRNFARAKKLLPAFERDWRRFVKAMIAQDPR
jgi:hypothetical protein